MLILPRLCWPLSWFKSNWWHIQYGENWVRDHDVRCLGSEHVQRDWKHSIESRYNELVYTLTMWSRMHLCRWSMGWKVQWLRFNWSWTVRSFHIISLSPMNDLISSWCLRRLIPWTALEEVWPNQSSKVTCSQKTLRWVPHKFLTNLNLVVSHTQLLTAYEPLCPIL